VEILERLEEHCEVQEVPFGRVYKWCPQSVVVECDCGESLILKTSVVLSNFKALCHCGAAPTVDIQEGCQSHLLEVSRQTLEDYEEHHHPWRYWYTTKDTSIPF
jgi:hypothetical protein